LKPGKSPELGTSYRPVSLLCPSAKVLERLLLPYLTESLSTQPTQHGFKPNHSTVTALLPLVVTTAEGFNEKQPPARTTAVAIDLSKAFDCVPHDLLLSKISNTSLHHNIVRWLISYLRGRTARVSHNSRISKPKQVRFGVPQGSVISPILFNFFIADIPTHPETTTSSYADDFNSFHSSSKIDTSTRILNEHIAMILPWCEENGMSLAPEKSSVTLYTPDTKQSTLQPQVKAYSTTIPLEKYPKILGVTLDTHHTFKPHILNSSSKASSRLRILKAVAGTSWGYETETLINTYKSLIRPILNYAAPIWYPAAKPSNIQKLQVIQNQALRICLGCHKKSSISHLHSEAKILMVDQHLELLSKQFLASALRPDHPSHSLVTRPEDSRKMKPTLQSRFVESLSPYLINGTLPPNSYKQTIKSIHTSSVEKAISLAEPNRVLGYPPPEIDPSESSLPRLTRTTLSQLRSSYCRRLRSYQNRINPDTSPTCPHCKQTDHTTHHLFNCRAYPTKLLPQDLWKNPTQVAIFLYTLPDFSDLENHPHPPPHPLNRPQCRAPESDSGKAMKTIGKEKAQIQQQQQQQLYHKFIGYMGDKLRKSANLRKHNSVKISTITKKRRKQM
jgi:hypothetical protein